MKSCPLCHETIGPDSEIAFVPVSPVIYPYIKGLEVHAGCLAAARRGAFERGRASRRRAIESFDAFDRDRADTRSVQRVVTEGPG